MFFLVNQNEWSRLEIIGWMKETFPRVDFFRKYIKTIRSVVEVAQDGLRCLKYSMHSLEGLDISP